jgi:hypothetical protein
MTTSGTATFNLDIAELIEEAFERCGGELRTGYDLRTARRSLNLLTIEWANRGINLWTVEQGVIPLVTGQATYELPVDIIDVLDMVIRTGTGQNQTDINISRIAQPTYTSIPNKNAQGRPIQAWIRRLSAGEYPVPFSPSATTVASPQITVWPTPNPPGNQYTLVFWWLRRIQDAGSSGAKTMDIPFRFLNCMVAGLAHYLSLKVPGVAPERAIALKQDYMEQLDLAMAEDREKAPIRFVPRIMR